MRGWMEKHTDGFRMKFREGLRGKIFKLCLIVIAAAVCFYAVLDMIQL